MRTSILAGLLLLSISASSQPWSLLREKTIYYYENDSTETTQGHFIDRQEVKPEGTIYFTNRWHFIEQDTIYQPWAFDHKATYYPARLAEGNPAFLVSIQDLGKGVWLLNGTQRIETGYGLGHFWLADATNDDTARIDFVAQRSFGGHLDSIKIIRAKNWELILSKNHGIVEFVNFNHNMAFSLVGIQDRFGYQRPNWRSIAPYQVDDVLEFKISDEAHHGYYATTWIWLKVLAENPKGNGIVELEVQRKYRSDGGSRVNGSFHSVRRDTFLIELDSVKLFQYTLRNRSIHQTGFFYPFDETASDLRDPEGFCLSAEPESSITKFGDLSWIVRGADPPHTYVKLDSNIGMTYRYSFYHPYGNGSLVSKIDLQAHEIGPHSFGSFIPDTFYRDTSSSREDIAKDRLIQVYPNYGTQIQIHVSQQTENRFRMYLVDAIGRMHIAGQEIEPGPTALDLSHLPSGMYTLLIEEKGSIVSRQKLMVTHD